MQGTLESKDYMAFIGAAAVIAAMLIFMFLAKAHPYAFSTAGEYSGRATTTAEQNAFDAGLPNPDTI